MADIYSYLFPSYSLNTVLFSIPFTIDFYSITDAPNGVLYFGDGTQQPCGAQDGARGSTCRVSHTYKSSGRYAVELRDATGKVLQRLSIYLPESGITPVARTTSDVNGSYRISVSPGTYSVFVKDSGIPTGCMQK